MTPAAVGASSVPEAGRELRRYLAAVIAVVVVLGALLGLVFRGPGDWAAIAVSGMVALVIQPLASVLGRRVGGAGISQNMTARMGLGALVRLFTLIAYAVVMAAAVRLPITAALVSLAAFYFVTSVIEPLLIKS